ncbi:MAG: Eco57I restriction-modification methylase domain-containing protein [Blastocatellia bacterium]
MVAKTTTSDAVYTLPWVVELILDLAGYTADINLVDMIAVEPAAGSGSFLKGMVERLIKSCRTQKRPFMDCLSSIRAYELDSSTAECARQSVITKLLALAIPADVAGQLTRRWIREKNYLLEVGGQINRTGTAGDGSDGLLDEMQADFVIGNPPYIRLEDIPNKDNLLYRKLFHTMTGRADIYVAFYEAALRQLKENGVCAFICADRWMLNQYGKELRRFITSGYSVDTIIEMHQAEAFETAVDSYPAVTIIRREQQGRAIVASASPDIDQTGAENLSWAIHQLRLNGQESIHTKRLRAYRTETWFTSADPWPCASPDRLELLKRLERDFPLLESEDTGTRVGIGVATGADGVYITDNPSLVEEDRLLPLALTDDIKTGTLNWSGFYLINPWNDEGLVSLDQYPKLKRYYETNEQRLRGRNVAKKNPKAWYKTIDRIDGSLLTKHKLYLPDIKNTIHAVLDKGETYPHHNLYFVKSRTWNLEVLGALLISDVGKFFVECYGVKMRGGYLRMQAQYLRRVRVPDIEAVSKKQAENLEKAFRERDVGLATKTALEIYGIDCIPA